MNVGELLRERERLIGVIQESKVAKQKLRQVDVLIAMYSSGDDAVDLVANGKMPESQFCVFGDGNPVKHRGICSTHYTRLRNGQLSVEEMKMVPPSKTGSHSRVAKKVKK